jgi:hypothetical protein
MSNTTVRTPDRIARWVVIAAVAGIALFASYRFASAQSARAGVTSADVTSADVTPAGVTPAASASVAGAGCACCGGSQPPAGAETEKSATIEGGVQRISVDVSKGYYDPSRIVLKAGVPAEITFSQSSGCTAQVQSADLGFSEDLTGGPRTVRLPALKSGTYAFSCGMQMVFGSIVVQ